MAGHQQTCWSWPYYCFADDALVEHIFRLDRRTAAGRALAEQLGAAGCRHVHAEFRPEMFLSAAESLIHEVADAAAATEQAAVSGWHGIPPAEGLAPEAAAGLKSGWATAFQPDPRTQAHVKAADLE